jgi:hypothetical protein
MEKSIIVSNCKLNAANIVAVFICSILEKLHLEIMITDMASDGSHYHITLTYRQWMSDDTSVQYMAE